MNTLEHYAGARTSQLDHNINDPEQMRQQFKAQQEELGKANRLLALDYAVTRALGDSVTLDDAASLILHTICITTGWDLGKIWDVDTHIGKSRKVGVWPKLI